ncbi:ABC transporter ATP-binding protein [Moorella sp. Hama-1]|uniref:ABC transporter ATP-binding protein n=1 Tax=Moorella sp. Hama-1 TaxID=2138101 RepID=UPI000D64DB8D|nr:ABC transporter ATP-binding protein [Moorella sp. Hama-1]MDN5360964.1 NitT/TauT family transport system ATP-binding protein [Moorella sp. (in: firmicutes)]BCV20279.1 ABC transporter ATP-binding protein [Moorella sp. Hama-1]
MALATVPQAAGSKLAVINLTREFSFKRDRVTALEGISLEVREGEFATILGPSGCGKSTLLRIIAGLAEASSGQVYKDGRLIQGPGADRGMVFQSYTLFPWLTVRQNIEFGLSLKGMDGTRRRQIVDHYLEIIGLAPFAGAFPKNLSGGMKQRVAIARALANDPDILLMDEPFGALDAQTRLVMQELLLKVWEETRKTILFVTHDVEEAIFLGDTIYIMTARPGRLKARLPVPLTRPRSFEVKNSRPFLDLKTRILEQIREESLKAATMMPAGCI